jgi:hypothetical protein
VRKVDFLVNGTLLCSAASSPHSCGWKVPTKSGVTYTVAAEALDVQGATSSESTAVTSQ